MSCKFVPGQLKQFSNKEALRRFLEDLRSDDSLTWSEALRVDFGINVTGKFREIDRKEEICEQLYAFCERWNEVSVSQAFEQLSALKQELIRLRHHVSESRAACTDMQTLTESMQTELSEKLHPASAIGVRRPRAATWHPAPGAAVELAVVGQPLPTAQERRSRVPTMRPGERQHLLGFR